MASDMDVIEAISFSPAKWETEYRRFSHYAMATIFEIYICHPDPEYAQQAARAGFERLDQLEQELSRFIDGSDISRINALPPNQPLVIGLDTFQCLQLAIAVHKETFGTFDITFGTASLPSPDQISIKEKTGALPLRAGIDSLILDEDRHSLTLKNSPIQIDLGGIGKGYALDQIAVGLREWEVEIALLHSGFSTVLALKAPPGTDGWPITISEPKPEGKILKRFNLQDRAFSGSGIRKRYHIIDPHTLQPITNRYAAWAGADTGARADALSTAFMVMAFDEIQQFCTHCENDQIVILDPVFSSRLWEYP